MIKTNAVCVSTCELTCLCLRKSSAIWTFCSRWNLIRPFSLGCNKRAEIRIVKMGKQEIKFRVFQDRENTKEAAVSANKADLNQQCSEVKTQQFYWREMILWRALSSTGAVKDMPTLWRLKPCWFSMKNANFTSDRLFFNRKQIFTNKHPSWSLDGEKTEFKRKKDRKSHTHNHTHTLAVRSKVRDADMGSHRAGKEKVHSGLIITDWKERRVFSTLFITVFVLFNWHIINLTFYLFSTCTKLHF